LPTTVREVEKMCKFFLKLMCLIFILALSSSAVFAAQSDSVAIKVTITPAISVNIAEDSLLLGSLAVGATKVSTTAVTVTNDSSGISETYSLSLANPSGWTAASASGVETYVLNAAFSNNVAGITWAPADHALSTSAVAASASKFAGDQTGAGVPYNGTRKLWFQFKAPTATTVSTEQSITVTITAQAS